MGFPLYKEWMGEVNKVGDVHVKGVKDFVKYAKRNLKSEEISCPCVRCRNGKCLKWTEVELHLVKWGMQQDYMFWKFHGEREFPYIPEQLPGKEPIQVDDFVESMGFPLYKEWMGEVNKVGDVHVKGVKDFVKYAKRNLKSEEISCPCVRCRNGKCLKWTEVELHLVKWGMQQDYMFWKFHGEREFPYIPKQLPGKEPIQVDDDHLAHPRLNDLINDAYGVHTMQANHTPQVEVLCEKKNDRDHGKGVAAHFDTSVPNDNDYILLRAAATRPLYPNCNPDHTMLYSMVGLHNLKSRFGLSDNSVTEILLWAKDLLPKENTLPDNYPNMKSSLKGLGIEYKSIHACEYDCDLYQKEHKDKLKCPVCEEPRFAQKTVLNNRNKIDTKVPKKTCKDLLHQAPERSDVFVESRRQRKTGEFHPQTNEEMQKVTEQRSSQDSSSPTTLDDDALTTLYGKDKRGKTRVVGPVSRTKLKAILPIRSEIEKAAKQSNMQMKQDMQEIKNTLNILLRASSESQKFPPQQFPSLPAGYSSSHSLQVTQLPTTASLSSCNLFNVSNVKKIATGVIISTATPGTVVHGHVLADYERKIQVIDVVPGEEGEVLYLESQGCATTIKETEGGCVVWPIWLIH